MSIHRYRNVRHFWLPSSIVAGTYDPLFTVNFNSIRSLHLRPLNLSLPFICDRSHQAPDQDELLCELLELELCELRLLSLELLELDELCELKLLDELELELDVAELEELDDVADELEELLWLDKEELELDELLENSDKLLEELVALLELDELWLLCEDELD